MFPAGRAGREEPGPAAGTVPPAPCRSPARVGSGRGRGRVWGPVGCAWGLSSRAVGHRVPGLGLLPRCRRLRSITRAGRGAARPHSGPLHGGGGRFPRLCSGCLWGLSFLLVLRRLSCLLGEPVIPRARPAAPASLHRGMLGRRPPSPRGMGRGLGSSAFVGDSLLLPKNLQQIKY